MFLELNRNTKLAQAVDAMMVQAKRIYILMIRVKKLLPLFPLLCFLREIENMFSMFLLTYRTTSESLGQLQKAWDTLSHGSYSHSISCPPKLSLVFSTTQQKHGTCTCLLFLKCSNKIMPAMLFNNSALN